ncbi:MAG TPA: D-2-hydroxyacid dehydrogenase [Gemmatimonadaceae bacterium]
MKNRKLVVDLRSHTPAFRLPDDVAAGLAGATPDGWTMQVVQADTESAGDGSQEPSEESLRAISDAEVYFGFGMPRPLWGAARHLRWIHSASAGVASLLFPEMLASEVLLTNSAGVYGEPIAEHVLAGVLYFLRSFDVAGSLQRRGQWDSIVFGTEAAQVREVSECRVLVVGAGGIGSHVARTFAALGATVTGIRRNPVKGTPPGFHRVTGPDFLDAELPSADVVVLAAPLTLETQSLLTAGRLAVLPPGAIVCNVGRGALIDEPALAAALHLGRLRGAVLDVFSREPLASDSPLWHLPQVLQTPHVAGVSPRLFWGRLSALFLDNFTRYRAGDPLRNLVDKQAGY